MDDPNNIMPEFTPNDDAQADTLQTLLKRLGRFTGLARLYLIGELYIPVLAKALFISALFIITTYLGLWERFGDPWRAIFVIGLLIYLAQNLLKAIKLQPPNRSDARRRLEQDNDLEHRPIDTLHDRPALSQSLWPAHYRTAFEAAHDIRRPKRRHMLAALDPYYLRYFTILALIIAAIVTSGFGLERLRYVLTPQWQAGYNPNTIKFEAWVDPPAYTGRPPIYFKDKATLTVPKGSEFVIRATGATSISRPKLYQGFRRKFITLTPLGSKSYEARVKLEKSARAVWLIGLERHKWAVNISDDLPPEIEFIKTPEADKRDRLHFTYSLKDDYGVESVQLDMVQIFDGLDPKTIFNDPNFKDRRQSVIINQNSQAVKSADNASAALDLTKHSLAGKKVIGRLIAKDGRGQIAVSQKAYFTVPDKIFIEPLAKAIAENRALILSAQDTPYKSAPKPSPADGSINQARYAPDRFTPNFYEPRQRLLRAPASVQRAALLIDAITDEPDRIFTDPVVYMGLRHVSAQLRYADSQTNIAHLPETLWKTALRAEFGVLGTALEEMREAQAALQEGLARRAPQREIDTLFERYNQAVDAYTEELRRQAIEDGNYAEDEGGGGGDGGLGSVDEIEELLKLIEEANKAGDVEGARKALARLAEVLENMQIQLARGGGSGSGDGQGSGDLSEEEQQALEDLADTIGEQRDLQDETRQSERAQQNEDNDENNSNNGNGAEQNLSQDELAQRQAELEDLLNQFAQSLPDDLGADSGPNQNGPQGGSSDQQGAGQQGQEQQGSGQQGSDPSGSGDSESGTSQNGDQNGGSQNGTAQGNGGQGNGGQDLDSLLEQARRAMRDSRAQLEAGDLTGAGDSQDDVINALREAGQALADAINRQQGDGAQSGEANAGDARDPLGRQNGNGLAGNDNEADIDSGDNAARARDLLEELRRRAAEQGRAPEELEYLQRLLKRF